MKGDSMITSRRRTNGEIINVNGFALGDIVDYHQPIGGKIVSKNHEILEFCYIDEHKNVYGCYLSDIVGRVPVDAISLSPEWNSALKSISNKYRDFILKILTDSSLEDAFKISLMFFKLNKNLGVAMAEMTVERMKSQIKIPAAERI
jgi:hypothetical protein